MTPEKLGEILSHMYHAAPKGEATTMIHMFGIKYADAIRDCGAPVAEIIRVSGLSDSYNTEVSKGVRLARYVVPRADQDGSHS